MECQVVIGEAGRSTQYSALNSFTSLYVTSAFKSHGILVGSFLAVSAQNDRGLGIYAAASLGAVGEGEMIVDVGVHSTCFYMETSACWLLSVRHVLPTGNIPS